MEFPPVIASPDLSGRSNLARSAILSPSLRAILSRSLRVILSEAKNLNGIAAGFALATTASDCPDLWASPNDSMRKCAK
jgi:hypothetical protein